MCSNISNLRYYNKKASLGRLLYFVISGNLNSKSIFIKLTDVKKFKFFYAWYGKATKKA